MSSRHKLYDKKITMKWVPGGPIFSPGDPLIIERTQLYSYFCAYRTDSLRTNPSNAKTPLRTSLFEVEMPIIKIRFLDAFKWKDKTRTENKPPFVPDKTKISELMDKDGYVWLFRVIDSPYQPGFDESRFI